MEIQCNIHRIYAGIDSSRAVFRSNIARLEASINQTYQRHRAELKKYTDHHNAIRALEDSLKNSLSNYERNKLQQELMSLRKRNIEEPVFTPPVAQMAELEAQRQAMSERTLLFSGHVTVLTFG